MKSKVNLMSAIAGAMGIGYNLPHPNAFWLTFFIAVTTANLALLLVWNRNKLASNNDKETKKAAP